MVKKKQRLFKLWKGPKKCKRRCRCGMAGGQKLCGCGRKAGNEGCSVDMETRRQARGEAKRAIFMVKNDEKKRFFEDLEREDEKGNLFRVAKQMVNRNRDVVGANCLKNSDGKIVVEEDRLMEVWRAHYDVLSNEECSWDREGLTDVSPVCGPSERISTVEVDAATGKMKQGKSGGPTGVVSEMLKAAGETGTLWMTDVCNAMHLSVTVA